MPDSYRNGDDATELDVRVRKFQVKPKSWLIGGVLAVGIALAALPYGHMLAGNWSAAVPDLALAIAVALAGLGAILSVTQGRAAARDAIESVVNAPRSIARVRVVHGDSEVRLQVELDNARRIIVAGDPTVMLPLVARVEGARDGPESERLDLRDRGDTA